MSDEDWQLGTAKAITVFLNGEAIPSPGPRGERVVDDTFLVLLSAHDSAMSFTIPKQPFGERWIRMVDTADTLAEGDLAKAEDDVVVEGRSVVLMRRVG